MQDMKVIVLMLALSELISDKFIVIDKDEMLESAQGDTLATEDLEEVLTYIEAEKLITVKYKDDADYCLAFTPKGLDTITDINRKIAEKKRAQELKIEQELIAREQAREQAIKAEQAKKLYKIGKKGKKVEISDSSLDLEVEVVTSKLDYLPASLNDLAEDINADDGHKVINNVQVIKQTFGKFKVFFLGLFGGFVGGGLSITTVILVEMFLL